MTWTNLNTGVMDSYTVAENINSYNLTGLNDNDNYNVSVTAVGVCGMITSDPVTVYCQCVSTYMWLDFRKAAYYAQLEIPILII